MPNSDRQDRYPDLDRLSCDPRMARLLFRAYYDEMTTVATYTYHSLQLADHAPHIASLFESISMTEMRHFRLLGTAIRRLGGNPHMQTELRVSPYELCRNTSVQRKEIAVRQAVRTSITSEQTAAWEYRALAAKTHDPVLKQLLCSLAADEEEHADMLKNLCG